MTESNVSGTIKRPLKGKLPNAEEKLFDFIRYTRSQRLPVTSFQVRAFTKREATDLGVTTFKASNSWLQKFVDRRSVQISFKLH